MPNAVSRRRAPKAPSIAIVMEPERDGVPLYAQLYRQLRDHMLSGRLAPGASLPSARTLAADLNLSRNTVETAMARLTSEGFITRRIGAGTVVSDMRDVAPFRRAGRDTARRAARTGREGRAPTPSGTKRAVPVAGAASPTAAPVLAARGRLLVEGGRAEIESDRRTDLCTTDVSHFPTQTWNRLLARVARERGASLLAAGELQGDAALRAAISAHASLTRGARCTADDVLVLNSTQQALDLAARLLLGDGDVALVEEPGYRSARATFAACGADVRGVPVDADGLQPTALEAHRRARLLFLTPSHQFPLGVTLGLRRRLATLDWAQRTGCWIIEDDYDSEFRYNGRPIAAMQGLDETARVLYVGTFNKVMFPAMRMAYLILPPGLMQPFVQARRLADGGPPTLMQGAMAEFLSGGYFAAHLRRSRRHFEGLRNLLVHCLETTCGAHVRIGASETGLHLVAHLTRQRDDERLARAGAGHGLGVAALSAYYAESALGRRTPRGLFFSFGGATEASIRTTVAAIAAAL